MHAAAQGISVDDYALRRAKRIAELSAELGKPPCRKKRPVGTDMRKIHWKTAALIERRRAEREAGKRPKGQGIPKVVVVGGKSYRSVMAAVRATGIPLGTIQGRLRGAWPKWARWDVNVATTG